MNMLVALGALLNVLGSVMSARGQESLGEYAKLGASLLREGNDVQGELEQLVKDIEAMAAEGRDPTPEEITAVRARRQSLSDAIRASSAD